MELAFISMVLLQLFSVNDFTTIFIFVIPFQNGKEKKTFKTIKSKKMFIFFHGVVISKLRPNLTKEIFFFTELCSIC